MFFIEYLKVYCVKKYEVILSPYEDMNCLDLVYFLILFFFFFDKDIMVPFCKLFGITNLPVPHSI